MAKEDEHVEDQEVDKTEEVNEETDDSAEEEETIESLKAKIAEKEKALAKANKERAANQRKYKELRDKEGNQDEVPELSDKAKRALAVSYLRSEGLNDVQAKKFSKLVNLDDIEVDDDGDLIGIDLDELKEDFPQLFNTSNDDAPAKKQVRKLNNGDKSGAATPPSGLSDVTKQMLKMARGN